MNWLARLDVDAKVARAERIVDSYAWHRKLWDCFPEIARGQARFPDQD